MGVRGEQGVACIREGIFCIRRERVWFASRKERVWFY